MYVSIILSIILGFSFTVQKDQTPTKTEIESFITTHNKWRAEVGVGPIQWSDDLSKSALRWAKKLKADNCGFYHSSDGYGENIWKGTAGYYTIENVVDAWGGEIKDYNYKTNKCKPGKACGHYTQIVWKNTTKVGCAKVDCDGATTWVCQYDPPGNWIGQKPY